MGTHGISFLGFILLAGVLHLLTALSCGALFTRFPGPGGEARFIQTALGSIPAIVLPICSRIVFTVCASTLILATAGYAFSEVFAEWFPKLGFSFWLLGFLLIINLLGSKISEIAQIIFVAIALFSLIFLSIVGLTGLGNKPPVLEGQPIFHITWTTLLGLFLFIGFDLAGLGKHSTNPMKPMIFGIIFVGTVFSIWGLVSIRYVPLEKLTDSTVPHRVVARTILDQTGRTVIGLVILAGSCSAVNALLISGSKMIASMATQGLLPAFLGSNSERAIIPLILLALGPAVMMGIGMAGEPETEVYTRASLLFWLLNYMAIHLSVLMLRKRTPEQSGFFSAPGYPFIQIMGLAALSVSFISLCWFDEEVAHLLKFMLILFVAVFVFSFFWINLSARKVATHFKEL